MSELDKFKRRMIRSVARLLMQEKKPEEEVWEELKKETGCDCKLLWQRMRALTLKKLKRLLAADDRVESIAAVARLSLTDWLLFDMVLVHEQIDVIGRDKITATNVEYKPMMELFSLVQRYSIEGAQGDNLAERWAAATVSYNTQGRHCSPMLLQRRWYQIKDMTRSNFYKLWFSYRGNQKLWDNAQQYRPSRLQMAIAKRYPHVVTKAFPTWEEQIEKQLIILPDVFDEKMRMSNLPKPNDENDLDIVVLEPVIETIDLGLDSDTEDVQDNRGDADSRPDPKSGPASVGSSFTPDEDSNTMTDIEIDMNSVKKEPEDEMDGLSNVKILQTTHITQGTIDNYTDITNCSSFPTLPNVKVEVEDPKETFKRNLLLNVNNFIESTEGMFQENEQTESSPKKIVQKWTPEIEPTGSGVTETEQETFQLNESTVTDVLENVQNELETQHIEVDNMIKEKTELFLKSRTVVDEPKIQNLEPDESDDIIKEKAEQFFKDRHVTMSATKDVSITTDAVESTGSDVHEDEHDSVVDEIIKEKANQYISKSVPVEVGTDSNSQENSNDFVVDDVIKQKAEEYIRKSDTKPDVAVEACNVVCNEVVVDDGMEFVDDGIEYIEEEDYDSDSGDEFEESRRTKFTNEMEENDGTTPKFDLKLLMNPTVYTMKLDNMTVLQGKDFKSVYDKGLIENIVTESKPVSMLAINILQIKQENDINQQLNLSDDKPINDDLFKSNDLNDSSEYESDMDISEDLKVKPTSYLLQKPRSRSYNPIQLCKNPDFNTRLKRLNVSFFISPRNRQLIKACKPMTIDVHKAFEPKLVNGTLYLKSNCGAPQPIIIEDNDQSERTAVVPSAMPAQSLIDNTIGDMLSPIRNANAYARSDETAERNKVINLPDITQIRLINQRLQTAEVTPIRVQHTNSPSSGPTLVDLSLSDKNLLNCAANETSVNLQGPINNPLLKAYRIDNMDAPVNSPPNQLNDDIHSLSSVKSVSTVNPKDNSSSSVPQSSEIDNVNPNFNLPANPTIARHSLPVDTSIVNPPLRQTPLEPKKLGRPFNKPDKAKMKAPPYYYPMSYRKSVPWNKAKSINTTTNLDEFLITVDTLNKMINKINGNDLYMDPTKKNKKQYWVIDNHGKKQKSNANNAIIEKSALKEPKTVKEKQTDKPKVSAGQNQAEGQPLLPQKKHKRTKECCWSSYRIEKLSLNKKLYKVHPCPLPKCNCCCQERLAVFLNELETKRQDVNKCDTSIVLSDDEDDALRNACASIETVVQQASAPTPIVRVVRGGKNISPVITTNVTQQTPVPPNISATNTGQGSIRVIEVAMMQQNPNVSSNSVVFSHSPGTSTSFAGMGLPLNISSKQTSIEQTHNDGAIVTSLVPEGTEPLASPKSSTPVNAGCSPSNKMYIPIPHKRSLLNTTKVSMETQTTSDLPLLQSISGSPPTIINKQIKQRQFALMPMDTYQRKLVIDGSKKCPITRTVVQEKNTKKERILSLNMTKKPTESPICLGKNKILLTTVKFPRIQVPQVENVPNPALIPMSPLPAGVHLLLMPNGELTYSLDPGVQLDNEQLSTLPATIAAIQQQINVSPVQPVAGTITQDEVIKLSDDENTSTNDENGVKRPLSIPSTNHDKTPVLEEEINQKTEITCTQEVTVDQSKLSDSVPNVENLKSTYVNSGSALELSLNTKNQTNTNSFVTTDTNSETVIDKQGDNNVETQPVTSGLCVHEETSKKTNTELAIDVDFTANSTTANEFKESKECNANVGTSNKEADVIVDDSVNAGSSRNLLSDLMEMSGISAEDTKLMPQESILQELLALSSNPAQLNNNTPLNIAVNTSADSETMNLPELTAVTSLAELKYACENNGQFFKLDLDTGLIVAINVCIKKNPKTKVKNFETATAIVDLTDEVESTNSEKNTSQIHMQRRLQKIEEHRVLAQASNVGREAVKPVKLFKAVHSMYKAVNKAPLLNRKAFGPKYTFVNSVSGGKIQVKRKRKQSLDKIEAKIDLVDSDAPMEEEYLLESSDTEEEYTVTYNKQTSNNSNKLQNNTVDEDIDDSSDDEPLAKKAQRMKCNDTNEVAGDQIDGGDVMEKSSEMETEMIEENPSEATATSISGQSTTNIADAGLQSEIPSDKMDTDNFDTTESDGTSLVSFIEDVDSDSQDDCILGV